MKQALSPLLKRHHTGFSSLFDPELVPGNTCLANLGIENTELEAIDFSDTLALDAYINAQLSRNGARYAYGGYLEDRAVYRRSALFNRGGRTPRSIHLGIDVWARAGTPVYLPLEGRIHSFRENRQFGDYGPTIIVRHQLEGQAFFTLYGHLDRESLQGLEADQPLRQGQLLCRVGPPEVNGNWPPHLHFQIIADMSGHQGDFPGVCTPEECPHFREVCPDPAVFFQGLFPGNVT